MRPPRFENFGLGRCEGVLLAGIGICVLKSKNGGLKHFSYKTKEEGISILKKHGATIIIEKISIWDREGVVLFSKEK